MFAADERLSCSNSKDSGNDQILGDDISSFDAMELPFANHVHYSKPLRVLQAVRKEPNPKQYLARLLTNR
jgi:hypothetical protein